MKELDELKNSWKVQKPASDRKYDTESISASSLSRLKKFEKRITKINTVKTIAMIIAVVLLIYSMLFAVPPSMLKTVGVIFLVGSIIIFWTRYLKMQLSTAKLNVKENSLDFIDDVLHNFSAQREFFRKDFIVFGTVLIAGINLIYLDLLKDMPVLERIAFHVIMSVVLIAVIFLGIKFRMRRFRNENGPIEQELLKIKEDLKEL